jgi:hypothetical protein
MACVFQVCYTGKKTLVARETKIELNTSTFVLEVRYYFIIIELALRKHISWNGIVVGGVILIL